MLPHPETLPDEQTPPPMSDEAPISADQAQSLTDTNQLPNEEHLEVVDSDALAPQNTQLTSDNNDYCMYYFNVGYKHLF